MLVFKYLLWMELGFWCWHDFLGFSSVLQLQSKKKKNERQEFRVKRWRKIVFCFEVKAHEETKNKHFPNFPN